MASGILYFQTLTSTVEAPFWTELGQNKIDRFKLDDSARAVQGYYAAGQASSEASRARLCLSQGSLLDDSSTPAPLPPFNYPAIGALINTNTMEDFKRLNWTNLLQEAGRQVWDDIVSGTALHHPWLLTRFLLATFADLKRYRYVYFFAFPSFIQQKPFTASAPQSIADIFTGDNLTSFSAALDAYRQATEPTNRAFFLARVDNGAVRVAQLDQWPQFFAGAADSDRFVGLVDASSQPNAPSWHLRNLLVLLQRQFGIKRVRVLCVREYPGRSDLSKSLVFDVEAHDDVSGDAMPKVTGWEKNESDKLQPRSVDLGASMDPTHLASTAVDLNLKLMRWRLLPELNLDAISSTRCLLLGAGTLGCNVARVLLGWGVRHITFVDGGKVSFSNPVRQSLFEFEDCLNGGKPKAVAAAAALKRIFPGVHAEGHDLFIHMPGHHISNVATARAEVERLESLIDAHDAVFILTDSREARWLPTLLCSSKNKILINCALGFDTFVVMRHGARNAKDSQPRLGCYYCNDVVAPTDSLSDRTLDQQCTVTRPGVSYLAASYGVEMLASILQHPDGIAAPAETPRDSDTAKSVLGIVPHQVRGFLGQFRSEAMVGHAYDRCTACSEAVLGAYAHSGFEFLHLVFDDSKHLERVTGLDEMHKLTEVEWIGDDDADGEDDF